MKILRTVNDLRQFVASLKADGHSVGLVPTMGALHAGHLSLVAQANSRGDKVVASLFVNPTQFNNSDDLATYPRKEDDDFRMLQEAGVSAVFAPAIEEIYPEGVGKASENCHFDLGPVAEVMEGRFRPGHFQGVALIVSKLLRFVEPCRAYFGEKDFQQIAVIRRMCETEKIPVEIVSCPIKRAESGLALSSRNSLLSPDQLEVAPEIHRALQSSVERSMQGASVAKIVADVTARLDSFDDLRVEYFEIVDGITLQPVADWDQTPYIVGCITVYCGSVRLIDNITYRRPDSHNC